MREDLVDIQKLMSLLGYNDELSVKKWCKARGIPILKLGLKKYVLSHFLTQYIDNQLVKFVKGKKQSNSQSENGSKKKAEQTPPADQNKYKPDNEIISGYLNKYETYNKSKTSTQRPS